MEYQIRQQAHGVGRGENNATRASLAFQTLGGDSRSLDLIIRYDALCDRHYLRHRRFLDIRKDIDTPNDMRRQRPAPEEFQNDPQPSPEPVIFAEDSQVPENEKRPNEPENILKTKRGPDAEPGNLRREPDPPHSERWRLPRATI